MNRLKHCRLAKRYANVVNIEHSLSTAHRWRYQFLVATKTVQLQVLIDIAEADETMFLLSFWPRVRGHANVAQGQQAWTVIRIGAGFCRTGSCQCNNELCAEGKDISTLSAVLKPFMPKGCCALHRWQQSSGRRSTETGFANHVVNLSASVRVGQCSACSERPCIPQSSKIIDLQVPRRSYLLFGKLLGLVLRARP